MSDQNIVKSKIELEIEREVQARAQEAFERKLVATGHGMPRSRREFLSTGLVGFSATLMLPYVLETAIFGNMAWAGEGAGLEADCGSGGSGMIPMLTFDLAGGASLSGNFLVGGRGGAEDLLASYSTLGWDPRAAGALTSRFGLPMAAQASTMLAGMTATATAAALDKLRMGSFLHFAQDDTRDNPLSITTAVTGYGAKGLLLANGLGIVSNGGDSGGNSKSLLPNPVMRPLEVRGLADITDSVSLGPAFGGIPNAALDTMVRAGGRLSEAQTRKYRGNTMGDLLRKLSGCASKQMAEFSAGAGAVDPRADVNCQQVYGINANSDPKSRAVILASVVMNVLRGNSGPGVITIGGCDYHTGDQATGDAKDREVGQEIGRAIELANRLGKKLFLHIISDGSVSARAGTRIWTGESGDRSMSVVGLFNPAGAPELRRKQVGHYTSGQVAATDGIMGPNAGRSAYAALANYLHLHGRLGEFTSAHGGVFGDQVDDVLIFG